MLIGTVSVPERPGTPAPVWKASCANSVTGGQRRRLLLSAEFGFEFAQLAVYVALLRAAPAVGVGRAAADGLHLLDVVGRGGVVGRGRAADGQLRLQFGQLAIRLHVHLRDLHLAQLGV